MATTHVTGAIDVVRECDAAACDLNPAASSQRRRVMIEGQVIEATFSPATQAPRYQAVIHVQHRPGQEPDRGDYYVKLLWHGQRSVPGVMAGTRLRCVAVVSFVDSMPTMFNPRYEIITPKRNNR